MWRNIRLRTSCTINNETKNPKALEGSREFKRFYLWNTLSVCLWDLLLKAEKEILNFCLGLVELVWIEEKEERNLCKDETQRNPRDEDLARKVLALSLRESLGCGFEIFNSKGLKGGRKWLYLLSLTQYLSNFCSKSKHFLSLKV